jgi:DNA-binding CsgD family transcriptional regulator
MDALVKAQAAVFDVLEGGGAEGEPIDALRVGAVLLSILASAAQTGALVVMIDDSHWIDRSSCIALRFALRRLRDAPVLALLAVRDTESDPFADSFPHMHIDGISAVDATLLLPECTPGVAATIATATGGNPLAMLELVARLTDDQRRGSEPLDLGQPLDDLLETAFLRKADGLSPDESLALLAAAVSPKTQRWRLEQTASLLGLPRATVERLFDRGLLRNGPGGPEVAHPLLRAAIGNHAAPRDRQAVHGALARVAHAEGDVEGEAWHLGQAADAPAEELASALDHAAMLVQRRGDGIAAAEILCQAAALSDRDDAAAARLLAAAGAFAIGGANERALEVFDAALERTSDPLLRADIEAQRVGPALDAGRPREAIERVLGAAAGVTPLDRDRAAVLLLNGSLGGITVGDFLLARDLRDRARALSTPDSFAAWVVDVLTDLGGVLEGRGPEVLPRLQPAVEAMVAQELGIEHSMTTLLVNALVWCEDFSNASRMCDQLVQGARQIGAVGPLGVTLCVRSDLYFRTGLWPAARADAVEAYELAVDSGHRSLLSYALTARARIEAALGHALEAHRYATDAYDLAVDCELCWMTHWAIGVLGFLELGELHIERAIEHLERTAAYAQERGLQCLLAVPWAPDLVEAYVRAGRIDDAVAIDERLDREGAATQGNVARAAVARCRALVATDDEAHDRFAEALELYAGVPVPFERARTELCLAERLVRDRRPKDAAKWFGRAQETFDALGATSWARRATRDAEPAHAAAGLAVLTPQELQVARIVGTGMTTREAAAALFLSPRTVDTHLARVYRKLGVRSRTELAVLLASSGV